MNAVIARLTYPAPLDSSLSYARLFHFPPLSNLFTILHHKLKSGTRPLLPLKRPRLPQMKPPQLLRKHQHLRLKHRHLQLLRLNLLRLNLLRLHPL